MAVGGLCLTVYALSGSIPADAEIWQVKVAGPALVLGGLLMSWIGYRTVKRGET
jgi:hypothetical protein